jgi:hypothetical protein
MDEMSEAQAVATRQSRGVVKWLAIIAVCVAALTGAFFGGAAWKDNQWQKWSETNKWACLFAADDFDFPGLVCDLHDTDKNPL